MKPYAQEAEDLRLLLRAGIVSIGDVVAWADRKILTLPEYDDDLTEISLGGNVPTAEMDARLERISEGADHFVAIRNLAGRMHQVLLTDRSRARGFADLLEGLGFEDGNQMIPKDLIYLLDQVPEYLARAEQGVWGVSLEEAVDKMIAVTAEFDTGDREES